MAKVRLKSPVSIYDHANDVFVTPPLTQYFDETDPFVKANRWAFGTDEEIADLAGQPAPTEVGIIEEATAEPGKRRATRKR